MNLRSVDLNLLVALHALLTEQHVTRAAERVGLSQPAMSNALSRLRVVFGDELLVRTASGMQPTGRALALMEPLGRLLRQTERIFESDDDFDPVSAQRTFTIRMSDILACLILPLLMVRRPERSGVRFDIVHHPPVLTVDALERGDADLAISMGLQHPSSIQSQPLMRDRMVCLMRKLHPEARPRLTLAAFNAQEHMRVALSPTDLRFVDDLLARRGEPRNVVLNVPNWLLVPGVLKETDLFAVMPAHLAAALMDKELAMAELPFETADFHWSMYWHRRHEQNSANRWLRDQVAEVCDTLA